MSAAAGDAAEQGIRTTVSCTPAGQVVLTIVDGVADGTLTMSPDAADWMAEGLRQAAEVARSMREQPRLSGGGEA